MRKQLKHLKKEKGFTLVELLAVIVILGIIAAIAVPMIGNVINDSKDKAILADAQTILNGAKLAHSSNLSTATTATYGNEGEGADISKYVSGLPSGAKYTVKLNETGKWTISYSEFKNIKDEDLKSALTGDVSEDVLKEKLQGKHAD